jgi:AmiR/NasT family two-component response regulator
MRKAIDSSIRTARRDLTKQQQYQQYRTQAMDDEQTVIRIARTTVLLME